MGNFHIIDIEYLKKGDILVSTTNATVSSVIRVGTHSVVSHAMLYIGDGEVIEAVGEGVKINNLRMNISSHGYLNVIAYRLPTLTSEKANTVVNYALMQTGKAYDFGGLVGAAENSDPVFMRSNPVSSMILHPFAYPAQMGVHLLGRTGAFQDENKYFCSELVFESYEKTGVNLLGHPAYQSYPQQVIDLGNRGVLIYLGNLN